VSLACCRPAPVPLCHCFCRSALNCYLLKRNPSPGCLSFPIRRAMCSSVRAAIRSTRPSRTTRHRSADTTPSPRRPETTSVRSVGAGAEVTAPLSQTRPRCAYRQSGSASGAFRALPRRCAQRVLGPGVLRVASAVLGPDLPVGIGPERGEIAGDRQRPPGGGEQVSGDGHTGLADAWEVPPPEALLQFDREHRAGMCVASVRVLPVC